MALFGTFGLSGCALQRQENAPYETIQIEPNRDIELARDLTAQAILEIESGHLSRAEDLLQEALVADVQYGPAHNNLGRIYFEQGQLYLAAWEFEYSSKLMPGRFEPLLNLGIVMESIDRIEDAVHYYNQAYEISPLHAPTISALARARVRSGEKSGELRQLLDDVVLRDDRDEWRTWAQEHLATSYPRQPSLRFTPYEEDAVLEGLSPVLPKSMPAYSSLGDPDWNRVGPRLSGEQERLEQRRSIGVRSFELQGTPSLED